MGSGRLGPLSWGVCGDPGCLGPFSHGGGVSQTPGSPPHRSLIRAKLFPELESRSPEGPPGSEIRDPLPEQLRASLVRMGRGDTHVGTSGTMGWGGGGKDAMEGGILDTVGGPGVNVGAWGTLGMLAGCWGRWGDTGGGCWGHQGGC